MMNALFVKKMDNYCKSSFLSLCYWLKEADISLLNTVFTDKVAQIKVAPTWIKSALPFLVLPWQLKYDICSFTWEVLECVVLTYYLIENGIE